MSPVGVLWTLGLIACCLPDMPWPRQEPLHALLVVPMLLNASRRQIPLDAVAKLHLLARLARRIIEVPDGMTMRLMTSRHENDDTGDVRLRLIPRSTPVGFRRLEVTTVMSPELGGAAYVPVLFTLADRGSPADTALSAALPHSDRRELTDGSGRPVTVRVVPAYGRWLEALRRSNEELLARVPPPNRISEKLSSGRPLQAA